MKLNEKIVFVMIGVLSLFFVLITNLVITTVNPPQELVKMGMHISFAGPITFKNNRRGVETVEAVPLDKILIETDSPYLAPEPVRGTRNDSRNVRYVAEKIAEIKGLTTEEVARVTLENAKRVYRIK
jgi:TatD DNase family protein